MAEKDLVIGVDLGGTRFRVCLADMAGRILYRQSWLTPAEEGPEAVLASLQIAAKEVAAAESLSRVAALGLGAPGPLNPWTGVLIEPPNLPGWNNVPVRQIMERGLGIPVFVGNDANLAALGELYYGAARGLRNIVYLTVSTGVGGGVIVDGRLLLGRSGLAAELGHTTVDASGPPCGCGNYGCLEALASGTAITREAKSRIRDGIETAVLALAGGDVDAVDAVMVEKAAREGDVFALSLLRAAGRYLGIGVANILHTFEPEMVIIGGGVSNAGSLLFDPMWDELRRRVMTPAYLEDLKIVTPELGDDAGLMGAVALAISELKA